MSRTGFDRCGVGEIGYFAQLRRDRPYTVEHLTRPEIGLFVPVDAKDLDVVRPALGRVDRLAHAGVDGS